jgi:hypothetical protein
MITYCFTMQAYEKKGVVEEGGYGYTTSTINTRRQRFGIQQQ